MAESFITQCPHCGTSFRVKNEQLAVANGSVRCGACLQVFSARNHVVTTAVPAQSIPKPTPKPAPAKAPVAAARAAQRPSPVRAPAKPPAKEDFGFAADDDDDAEFLFSDGADDDDFLFNDSPDDSLFDDDEIDDGLGELSDSFMNLHDSSKTQKTANHFQKEAVDMAKEVLEDDTDDESWAESMLEEIVAEAKVLGQGTHTISFVCHQDPVIEADVKDIRSVFGNIIFNAVRHNPRGANIIVRATSYTGFINISVKDDPAGKKILKRDDTGHKYRGVYSA